MAGGSLIGSLRVALGLDSAQFTAGLAKARGEIGGFSNSAKIGFAAVGAAASAAGTALGFAVKKSLDHADALGKAAQKAGTSVEALSRLEYAARLSDVSMEGLTGSLTKLGKAMVDASVDKGGQAAIAFRALGISVVDSSGHLRDTSAVFADVADRFGRMQDGATKGTLAMQLFGKSGAELIPLLNSGSNGLKQMADESDRVGFTLSKKTSAAAEGFNDSMERLHLTLEGSVNRLLPKLTPLLTGLTETLAKTDPQTLAVAASVAALGTAAGVATPAVAGLTAATKLLYAQLALIAALPAGVLAIAGGAYLGSTTPVGAGEDALIRQLGLTKIPNGGAWTGGWGSGGISSAAAAITIHGGNGSPFIPGSLGTASSAAAKTIGGAWSGGWGSEGLDPYAKMMERLAPVLQEQHSPMGDLMKDLKDLDTLYAKNKITTETWGSAIRQTYANAAQDALNMAGGITGALASMFKDNKQFAVANAVVQTLSGVANAIGSGPPPWNFVQAAGVLATGVANVSNILSTSENSTSVPGTSAATASSTAAAAAPRQAVNISLQGGQFFSRGQVEQLLDSLADAMGDGAGGRLINVITG